MGDFDYWLRKMSRLKVDRARGDPAPHKPLLLLVVLDLAEQGELGTRLTLTPEVAYRFFTYWSIVAPRRRQRPDVRLPFHHLHSDGFWSALDEYGNVSPDRKVTRLAVLPSDFHRFAHDPASRDAARSILIATYFTEAEQIALRAALGLPAKPKTVVSEPSTVYQSPSDALRAGREARFRLGVVAAYNYACALTGYSLTTITAGSIVDAAHIHEFRDSRNNDVRNGLALCKNAHWSFDLGLWTISDDYRVIVAVGKFKEDSPNSRSLAAYHGEKLRLPVDPNLWPNPIHLAWHRKNRFLGV
jgi:putative restriction endonuclease